MLVTLYIEYYSVSVSQYVYNSKIIIRFLHYDLLRPLFLAIIRDCVSEQPPAHAVSSLADFSTLKMETIRSSELSIHTRSTRHHTPEDGFLSNNTD
jgi:hypothetical protein